MQKRKEQPMAIEPIGDRILVKPKTPDEKSKSGLLLAKQEQEKTDTGTIVNIGDGQEVQRFKVGDTIIFQRYGPSYIKIDKQDLIIVNIDEILGREI